MHCKLGTHPNTILSVAINENQNIIVSGDYAGRIKFWNLKTQREKKALKLHESDVFSMILSKTCHILASGGPDSTIKIINFINYKMVRTLSFSERIGILIGQSIAKSGSFQIIERSETLLYSAVVL